MDRSLFNDLQEAATHLKEKFRAAADDVSPQEAFAILKTLAKGKTSHLMIKPNEPAPGGPVEIDKGNVVSYAALPEPAKELERIIGSKNFLPVWFLEAAVAWQRPVGRVIFKAIHQTPDGTFFPGDGWGTGFLVSPSLLMTNNHVIETAAFAKAKVWIQFNFQSDPLGNPLPTEEYDLDPDNLFRTNAALDYTLVRVKRRSEPAPTPANPLATIEVEAGQRWGHLQIEDDTLLFLPTNANEPKQQLNIIQHPDGRRKEVAIHDNVIDDLTTEIVRYTTDTEPGSSGSPVFNNLWQLVALHHAGGVQVGGVWKNNEGIRLDQIAQDLRDHLQQSILTELGL